MAHGDRLNGDDIDLWPSLEQAGAVLHSARKQLSRAFGDDRYRSLFCALIVLLGLSFLALNSDHSQPSWDELWFLHRAACINRTVFAGSLSGIDICLIQMFKSPIMAVLLLPAGPIRGIESAFTIAPVCLALMVLTLLVGLGWILSLIRLPLAAVVISVLAAFFSPTLFQGHGTFFVDDFLALVVLLTLLLPVLEWTAPPQTQGDAFHRGTLWGGLLALGVLSKLTYLMFAGAIAPLLLLIAYRRSGLRQLMIEALAALPFGLFCLFMLARYGSLYYAHGANSAFGQIAWSFYNDHVSLWAYLRTAIMSNATTLALCGVLACWSLLSARRDPKRLLIAAYSCAVVVVYLIIAAGSPNKDVRFFWPVWLALPFTFAAGIVPRAGSDLSRGRFPAALPLACCVLLSLSMVREFDLRGVDVALTALNYAHEKGAKTLLVADDTAHLNVETVILARELDIEHLSDMSVGNVAYDVANGITVQESLARLEHADAALFFPLDGSPPSWANSRLEQFKAAMTARPRQVDLVPGADGTIVTFPPKR